MIDYTFRLKELHPALGMPCEDQRSKLESLSVQMFAYALTMVSNQLCCSTSIPHWTWIQIKYILNQYKTGAIAEPVQEFSHSEYANDWQQLYNVFNQWSKKVDHCRQDISLVSNTPIGTGFGPQNITVMMSQETHHQHVFLIRIAETIFHMRSKLRRNYAIKCVYFLRFQRWYIHPNPCIIDGDVITTRIFTGFGKSVHRAVWRGFWHCLERCTSGLIIVGSIRVLGPSFNSQVLLKIAGSHIGCNLFGLYLLFYCMDSSQIWYRWKGIFKENPTPYVTKDEDYFLWKTSAITEIAPLGSFQRYWWLSNPDSSFLDVSPSAQDVLLQFGTDLGEICVILDQKHDFH